MRLGLILHLFRSTARHQRRRLVLTISAVAWGTLSIVLLLSFGEGLKRSLMTGRRGLGEGIAIAYPGETQKAFAGFPPGRAIRPIAEDVRLLEKNIPEIGLISGEMRTWGAQVSYGEVSLNKRLTGVEPSWALMRAQVPEPGGRFIDRLDLERRRRVIFLGNEIRDQLFGEKEAVGEKVLVNNVPFTVIGVLRKKMQIGTYGGPDASNSVIPLSTFEAVLGRRELSNIVFKARSPGLHTQAMKRFYEVLGGRYRFDPSDERAMPIWDTVESLVMMSNVTIGIEVFLGIVGAMTLLVGGIGVANIMYATVRHRTKEIGILMALGARRSWVMGPLIVEALSLTFAGGFLGAGGGAAMVTLLASLQASAQNEAMEMLGTPTFSPLIALTTVLLLGLVGFVAGYFPSRRAVAVQPAEVLREE